MTSSLRAEWLKLITTRTFRGMLCAAAAAGAVAAFVGTAHGAPPWDVTEPLRSGTAWSTGTLAVILLAVIVGSRTVTEEFAQSTIVHTFIADPRRLQSTLAKAAVSAVAAMLVAAVTAAAIAATAYAMVAITGGVVRVYGSDSTAGLGVVAAAGALGVIGAGLGALVRHPVPAIVATLLWLFVAETLIGLFAGAAAGYLPGKLAIVVAGVPQGPSSAPLMVAVAVLATYAAVMTLAGLFAIRRRDVL